MPSTVIRPRVRGSRGQIEQTDVRGDAGLAEAAHEPPAGEVIQQRQAHRDIDRMVQRGDRHAGAEL